MRPDQERGTRAGWVSGSSLAVSVLSAMWAAAGVLDVLGVLLVPEGRHQRVFLALSALAAVAALTLRVARQVPIAALHALLAGASLGGCVAVLLNPDPAAGTQVILIWPALYAGYFLPRRAASGHVAVLAAGYAAALALAPQGIDATRFSVTVGTLSGAAAVVLALRDRLESLVDQLRQAALTDGLTGLLNRRGFELALEQELHRAERHGRPLSLVLADLDHFKSINDRYGHPTGDHVLVRTASTLRAAVRDGDVVARIGGEEFAALLTELPGEAVHVAAERLREAVAGAGDRQVGPVTLSLGVASYPYDAAQAEELLRVADGALYAAKSGGRNRVCHAGALLG